MGQVTVTSHWQGTERLSRPGLQFTGDIDRYPAGPTQFARAMEELGVRQIFARSPQAKGRVERAAATFQDRLVTELRLAGASTITEADELLDSFLPRFNRNGNGTYDCWQPARVGLFLPVPLFYTGGKVTTCDGAVAWMAKLQPTGDAGSPSDVPAGEPYPAQDAFRLHRLEDPFLVVNAFIARHDEGSLGTTV